MAMFFIRLSTDYETGKYFLMKLTYVMWYGTRIAKVRGKIVKWLYASAAAAKYKVGGRSC
jgi:hypothetical protein